MMSFSRRCLPALVAILVGSSAVVCAETDWTAVFPGENGDQLSAAFAVGDGRHVVAVALSGARAKDGALSFSGRKIPADVFPDPVSRLVIFRISGPPGEALPLADSAPSEVEIPVQCPGRGKGRLTGRIKRFNGKILPLALLKVDYEGAVPLAGTPLMNGDGRVVSVAHQTTGAGAGYALPVEVIRRVLEDVQRAGRVSHGWIGVKLRPGAALPQVTEVKPGSPSAQAGMESGDVLLEIGSRRLVDYADAVNAFYFLNPGTPTPVRVKRGELEVSLSVVPIDRAGK